MAQLLRWLVLLLAVASVFASHSSCPKCTNNKNQQFVFLVELNAETHFVDEIKKSLIELVDEIIDNDHLKAPLFSLLRVDNPPQLLSPMTDAKHIKKAIHEMHNPCKGVSCAAYFTYEYLNKNRDQLKNSSNVQRIMWDLDGYTLGSDPLLPALMELQTCLENKGNNSVCLENFWQEFITIYQVKSKSERACCDLPPPTFEAVRLILEADSSIVANSVHFSWDSFATKNIILITRASSGLPRNETYQTLNQAKNCTGFLYWGKSANGTYLNNSCLREAVFEESSLCEVKHPAPEKCIGEMPTPMYQDTLESCANARLAKPWRDEILKVAELVVQSEANIAVVMDPEFTAAAGAVHWKSCEGRHHDMHGFTKARYQFGRPGCGECCEANETSHDGLVAAVENLICCGMEDSLQAILGLAYITGQSCSLVRVIDFDDFIHGGHKSHPLGDFYVEKPVETPWIFENDFPLPLDLGSHSGSQSGGTTGPHSGGSTGTHSGSKGSLAGSHNNGGHSGSGHDGHHGSTSGSEHGGKTSGQTQQTTQQGSSDGSNNKNNGAGGNTGVGGTPLPPQDTGNSPGTTSTSLLLGIVFGVFGGTLLVAGIVTATVALKKKSDATPEEDGAEDGSVNSQLAVEDESGEGLQPSDSVVIDSVDGGGLETAADQAAEPVAEEALPAMPELLEA